MNQRTHTWLAIRAVGLLDDLGAAPGLVSLLKPYVKEAAIGSWIPDMQDSKAGGGDIDNHVMKMKPYSGPIKERFVVDRSSLLKRLGTKRKMAEFIRNRDNLGDAWWKDAYKADPQPGQHLANRAMSIGVTLADLLILGDSKVARKVPGTVRFASNLDLDARTRETQAATYFFMMSHFIADSCMPCHCDARALAAYSKGLHKELESDWSRKVGIYFDKSRLLKCEDGYARVISKSKEVDGAFGINGMPDEIPSVKKGWDIWSEIMNVCRGSFVVNSLIAPPAEYPYGSGRKAPFETLFSDDGGKELLDEMNAMIMHDSVLNIAVAWKNVWERFHD